MNKALIDINDERCRQISGEDWSHDHDDKHIGGSLAAAAACYANPVKIIIDGDGARVEELYDCDMPLGWPDDWDYNWWKPGDRRRDLVKAGALIVAEIERLDRATEKEKKAASDG